MKRATALLGRIRFRFDSPVPCVSCICYSCSSVPLPLSSCSGFLMGHVFAFRFIFPAGRTCLLSTQVLACSVRPSHCRGHLRRYGLIGSPDNTNQWEESLKVSEYYSASHSAILDDGASTINASSPADPRSLIPDAPRCSNGMVGVDGAFDTCCRVECGICGTSDCIDQGDGECCAAAIVAADVSCDVSGEAPCVQI